MIHQGAGVSGRISLHHLAQGEARDLMMCHRAGTAFGTARNWLNPQALGASMPCIVNQLVKAGNQPVLVVVLGYMPKP